MNGSDVWVILALGTVALLYSTVGHAGASGFLAVMAFAQWPPSAARPSALTLNLAVSILVTWQFWRAGHFRWKLWWPFAATSIPSAFLAAKIPLPTQGFRWMVAGLLAFSAIRLLFPIPSEREQPVEPGRTESLVWGTVLGTLAGLTGTGGGIFLTPLVLLRGWATPRIAGAVSAAFIGVNSAAGLASAQLHQIPLRTILWAVPVVVAGGAVGSFLGSRRLDSAVLRRLLAAVLCVAVVKLLPLT